MSLKNHYPITLIALLPLLLGASCQTNNGFAEKEIKTSVAEQVKQAQAVDLPPPPESCTSKYKLVKVVLPAGSRLESDARRLRAGLDLANTKIATANAQIERCLGKDGWYEIIRDGFKQPLDGDVKPL